MPEISSGQSSTRDRSYGDLSRFNTARRLLEAVGSEGLAGIADDFLRVLGTSCAVYEKNGDYALGIFSSGWCQALDEASYRLCRTDDPTAALASGHWLCHESCWHDAARASIEAGEPVDVDCHGGIRLFAVPIRAYGEVVGSINFGYGDPPDDRDALARLAEKFEIPIEALVAAARLHPHRSPELIEEARRRLHNAARLIGLIVERYLAQQEAQEAAERYRLLFETMDQGAIFMDTAGQVVEANPAACRILGRTLEELARDSQDGKVEALDEEGRPLPFEQLPAARAVREARRFAGEAIGIHNPVDGQIHWIRGEVVPLTRAGESHPHQLYNLFWDVTAQKQAEESLRKSERFNRRIAEVMPNTLYVVDVATWRFLFINPEVRTQLGLSPEEVLAMKGVFISQSIHPEDLERYRAHLRRLADLPDDAHLELEYRMRTVGGEWRWYLSRDGVFERDASGAVTQVVGTATDITELKESGAALRESEQRFRAIFEQAAVGVALIESATGRFLRANRKYRDILGLSAEGISDSTILEFSHPDEVEEVRDNLQSLMKGEVREITREKRYCRKDGSIIWVNLSVSAMSAPGERPDSHIAVVEDITDRKRAETEQRRIEEQMRHVQQLESLGVLAGGIAHDFNNMLMSVLGNADLALSTVDHSHPVRSFVDDIKTASQRAAELCNQMLAYAGKGRFVLDRLDLSHVVREMGHILQVSVSKNAALRYELANDLPPVEADASQIRQVVMNLITNATDAVGDTPGVVSVKTGQMRCEEDYLSTLLLGEELAAGSYVFLEVADTGIGMDEATQERIFDPFFTTKFTGRGLGLAATLGIVRGHQGGIKLYSEPGEGTTFKVLLSVATGDAEIAEADSRQPATWSGSGTILLVDDEPQVRKVASTMLRRLGFEVIEAADGQEAIERFREDPEGITCVLLDLTMPRMGGEEAFRQLRSIRDDVRVVLSSGYNEQEITQRFAGKDHAGFIQKPYTTARLKEALQAVLAHRT